MESVTPQHRKGEPSPRAAGLIEVVTLRSRTGRTPKVLPLPTCWHPLWQVDPWLLRPRQDRAGGRLRLAQSGARTG